MRSAKKKRVRLRLRRRVRAVVAALDWLRYRGAEYATRSFVRALPWMPDRTVYLLAGGLGRLTFVMLRKYRLRMEQNLALAMSDELPLREQRQKVIRQAWGNFARGAFEILPLLHVPRKEKVLATVVIEGEEHLQRALARGKGVIALSAHLGNFTMIGIRLAAAGYAFSVLVKQPRDPRFARLWDHYRSKVGIATVSAKPRREAVRGMLKALRANRVVLMIADEFKSGDVAVDFFGVRSPAPRGPATLALRTGAAIVPMFVIRDAKDRLTLHVEPEIELIKTGDREQDVAANTVLFTRHLEEVIRRHPEQWNWIGFQNNAARRRRRDFKADDSRARGTRSDLG